MATENHRLALEQLVQRRLQVLVEDALVVEEDDEGRLIAKPSAPDNLPISTQLSDKANTEQHQNAMLTRPNSSKVRSPNMAGSLLPDKGSLPPDMRSGQLITTKDFNDTLSRQKLRLSAEGLLDIVTDQYLDSRVLKDRAKKTSSAVATGDPSMKRNPSEAKGMTILTPIITENSELRHPDSSPEAG